METVAGVILILTIITAVGHPNWQRAYPEASIEKCWEDARAFLEQGIPKIPAAEGAMGLIAGCSMSAEELKKLKADPRT